MIDQQMPWILAIEPDADRAEPLGDFIREWVAADVLVVSSPEAAITTIDGEAPTLILLSSLMPAADRARLVLYLRDLFGDVDLPLLTLPEAGVGRPASDTLVRPPGHRALPAIDGGRVGHRIRQVFEVLGLAAPAAAVHDGIPRRPAGDDGQAPQVPLPEATDAGVDWGAPGARRLRDHRWASDEMPEWRLARLAPEHEARVVNVSRTGLLLECGTPLPVGDTASIELSATGASVVQVSGRVVRSGLARTAMDQRFLVAVRFEAPIELPGHPLPQPLPAGARLAPELETLLDHVRLEAARGTEPALVRAAFELGVQHMVTAREVRLLPLSGATHDGSHTVCLAVPGASDSRTVLQAVFDETQPVPGAADLELLRAAAVAAAEVLAVEAHSRRRRTM